MYLKARNAEVVLERLEEHILLGVWKPEDRFDLAVTIPDDNERNLMAGILLGFDPDSRFANIRSAQ